MVFVIADVPISDRLPSPDVVPNVPDEDSRVDWSQYELTDNSDLVGSTDETHSERDPNHNYQVDDQTQSDSTIKALSNEIDFNQSQTTKQRINKHRGRAYKPIFDDDKSYSAQFRDYLSLHLLGGLVPVNTVYPLS